MPSLSPKEFLQTFEDSPILDLRSPSEFHQGNIPGAINFPLFTNEERAVVGTLYKQQGKDAAVLEGLRIVGPKMASLVEQALVLAPHKNVRLHCWRGGMRSESVAWLLEKAGFSVSLLVGGYKSYRHFVREQLKFPFKLLVLSGPTGSGKTLVLKALQQLGEQVIDLEGLAHHKGSAFGALGETAQPSIEAFENQLYANLLLFNKNKTIWIEDESRKIGTVHICDEFWNTLHNSPIIALHVPREMRINFLVETYGLFDTEHLKSSVLKIKKRLGGLAFQTCIEALDSGDLASVAAITLDYYDKAYQFSQNEKSAQLVETLYSQTIDPVEIAEELIRKISSLKTNQVNDSSSIPFS